MKTCFNWNQKKILIVEDVDSNYKFLLAALKPTQAEILRAKDGRECLDIIKTSNVDMVLMDIQMPQMDGIEATQEIRKYDENLPIIAQTAYALKGDKEKCLQQGFSDYIAKPIKQDQLLNTISRFFIE